MNNELYRGGEPVKKYGNLPHVVKENVEVDLKEMMFYQDMPVRLAGYPSYWVNVEERLEPLTGLILDCMQDFVERYLDGDDAKLSEYNVYLSAKRLFVSNTSNYNRPGWHSDGFMSDDVNYVWSDKAPTIFNTSDFKLSQDHYLSIDEMEEQAKEENNVIFPNNCILCMDETVIHKVNEEVGDSGIRTFVKVTISKDKYNLEGNTHNYKLIYDWEMRPRKPFRNVPQKKDEETEW